MGPMKLNVKQAIRIRLANSDSVLALHEFKIEGTTESVVGARLREMTRAGETYCLMVPGKRYKAWGLTPLADYDFKARGYSLLEMR